MCSQEERIAVRIKALLVWGNKCGGMAVRGEIAEDHRLTVFRIGCS